MTKPITDIGHAVDDYLGELTRQGRTKATRTKYREVLYPFADTLEHKAIWEVEPSDCRRYLDRWANAAPSTIALYVSILTRFFAFCQDEGLIADSPMARIRRPPLKRPEELDVVTVGTDDVLRLFAACQDEQEFLCVAMLAYLGPRRTAAARVKWEDVDFDRGTIRFREKGGKVIVKPVPDELREILYALAASGRVPAAPGDYVIPNRRAPKNRDRSPKIIYATVKKVAGRAGVNAHPHALRAAFAVHYLEGHEGDLDALQKLMGHTRAETTQVYLRRQDKFKAMERVRNLSWGSVLPPSGQVPPAGFEPAIRPKPASDPIRRKLRELEERSRERELS